jgi:hypothetical protein
LPHQWYTLHLLDSTDQQILRTLPPQKALFHGTIERVLKQDSSTIRCLIKGHLNHRLLPSMESTTVLLTIFLQQNTSLDIYPSDSISAELSVRLPRHGVFSTDFNEILYYSARNCS